jgi:hypothetical protein
MVSDVWLVFGLVGFRVNKFCSKSWVYLGRKQRTGWFPRCAVARVFGCAWVPKIAPGAKRAGFWDEKLFLGNFMGVFAGCRGLLGLCMVFLFFAVWVPFFVGVEKWFWFSGSFWLSRGKSRGTCPGLGGLFAPRLVSFPLHSPGNEYTSPPLCLLLLKILPSSFILNIPPHSHSSHRVCMIAHGGRLLRYPPSRRTGRMSMRELCCGSLTAQDGLPAGFCAVCGRRGKAF